MDRSFSAALTLTLLAVSLPVHAEERSHPSPTTTARRSGVRIQGARRDGRRLEGGRVPTRRHGSDVNTRSADDARRPDAARISVRKAKG